MTFTPAGDKSGATVVLPATRAKSHRDWYAPLGPGTMAFVFSNKHSRFTAKTLHYRVLPGLSERECKIRCLKPFTAHMDAEATA